MSKFVYISRYTLIIRILSKRNAAFEEINDYLKQESELRGCKYTISKRTFQRDLNEIRSLFNIDIQYSPSLKAYHIAESYQTDDFNEKILDAFDLVNSLSLSRNLSEYVILDKHCLQGAEHIYGLLHCIKNRLIVSFYHKKHYEENITYRTAEPYAIKEFKGRWYLIAKDREDNYIKSFGLDRILNIEISREHFKYPENFSVKEYFRDCYGILTPDEDGEPEEIILSFDPEQGKYIKSFPLHTSQEIIVDNEDEYRIKLQVHITYDFLMELLSYGDRMKIISPKFLKKDILAVYKNAISQYK